MNRSNRNLGPLSKVFLLASLGILLVPSLARADDKDGKNKGQAASSSKKEKKEKVERTPYEGEARLGLNVLGGHNFSSASIGEPSKLGLSGSLEADEPTHGARAAIEVGGAKVENGKVQGVCRFDLNFCGAYTQVGKPKLQFGTNLSVTPSMFRFSIFTLGARLNVKNGHLRVAASPFTWAEEMRTDDFRRMGMPGILGGLDLQVLKHLAVFYDIDAHLIVEAIQQHDRDSDVFEFEQKGTGTYVSQNLGVRAKLGQKLILGASVYGERSDFKMKDLKNGKIEKRFSGTFTPKVSAALVL